MAAHVKITKCSKSGPSDESTLRRLIREEGRHPYTWSNSPGDVYGAHSHGYHKVIFVVRGSITFGMPDTGDLASLKSGDRLDLPAGVTHNAVVGPQGVVCLEAHHSSENNIR